MVVLLDEGVARSVELVFRERSHEVRYVVEEPGAESPDVIVAAHAHRIGAAVVTWNYKHYRRLINRRQRSTNELTFPNMGLIGFQCPELDGPNRLRAFIELVEREYECVQKIPDRPFHVLVGHSWFQAFR